MKRCPTCESTYPNRFSICPQDGAKLAETSGWSEGVVIRGKYRILSKVGQGGMGAVYKASHVTFDELRALKVMNPELLGDELFVKRFKQEAIIARKLDHPNAVRVDDIDESEDGMLFMVMEYIVGQSLKSLIEESGPLPAGRTCSIITQVSSALNAAHQLGMVHRDIKPANIVLIQTPAGEQAKVLDFGIAKIKEAHSADSGLTLTGTGMVMGTPQYMSPEQALGKRGDQLDGRSDIYSLGIVMYQMLTASLPFKTDTTMQLLMAHINTPPRPILEARPDLQIPPAIARVVMKCLEKDPAMRPSSGAALIQELSAAEGGLADAEATRLAMNSSQADMATLIATPGARAATAPDGRPAPTAGAPPLATTVAQAPLSLEPPAVAAPASGGSRWLVRVLAVVLVGVAAVGAVWGVRHFGSRPTTTPPVTPPVVTRLTASAGTAGGGSIPPPAAANPTPSIESPAAQPAISKAESLKPGQGAKPAAKGGIMPTPKHPAEKSIASVKPRAAQQPARTGPQIASVNPPRATYSPPPAGNPSLGTVVITGTPGAAISMDGKPAGKVNSNGRLTLRNLPPGQHVLRASLTGFGDIPNAVNLAPGGTAFWEARFESSQAISGQTTASPAPEIHPSPGVAASFPVEYLRVFGTSKGLLAIEGRTVRYQPSNGKDAFTFPLAGISWGSSGGSEFYVRQSGHTYKFRSASSAAILSTLRRAAAAP